METFFAFEADLPDGAGFSRFGLFHLAWLAAETVLCVLAARCVPRWKAATRRMVGRIGAVWMAGSELVRIAVLQSGGHWGRTVLPLHLCSMAVWLCLAHAWRGWDWVGQTLYALCLPGACAALLFPDWVIYPPGNYFCLHSFAIHAGTVLYIVAQTADGAIFPRRDACWKPVLFLCAVVPPVYWVDRRMEVNYCFLLQAAPGSPLVLLEKLGAPWYLPGYAAMILAVIGLMLAGAQYIRDFAQKKQKKNARNR